jgi:hypothetical protein
MSIRPVKFTGEFQCPRCEKFFDLEKETSLKCPTLACWGTLKRVSGEGDDFFDEDEEDDEEAEEE